MGNTSPIEVLKVTDFIGSIEKSNAGAYLLLVMSFVLFALVGTGLFFLVGMHLSSFFGQILGILGAALLWRKFLGDKAAPLPTFKLTISIPALIVSVLAAVVLGVFATNIASLLIESNELLKSFAEDYMAQISSLFIEATGWEKAVGLFSVCLVAPICEEVLFRGTILQEQRKRERVFIAVLINGIIFSAFHLNPISALGLIFIGSFLAHITIQSGSLLPAIIAHASVNTTNALIIPAFKPESVEVETQTPLSELALFGLALAALGAFLWWLALRLINRSTPPDGSFIAR